MVVVKMVVGREGARASGVAASVVGGAEFGVGVVWSSVVAVP